MSDNSPPDASAAPTAGAIFYGMQEIAAFLGMTERQARHLADKRSIPTFRLPKSKIICASRDTLQAWLREHEAAAQAAPEPTPPEPPPPPAGRRGRKPRP